MSPGLPDDEARGLLALMVRIRRFEERAGELFRGGEIPGFIHLSLGQESVAAGVVGALRAGDRITATHRGHGHVIAKGMAFRPMMAELMARTTGSCHGKGGSMHIFDHDLGVLGANAILGAGQPIAVGAAMSARLAGRDDVAATFFGEGASAQGAVHEAMNLAAVWRAPVLFVAEINGYAELTPYAAHVAVPSLAVRAQAYGFPGSTVDGGDAEAVRVATHEALERMRAGGGPELLEIVVRRWGGHFEGDQQRYRSAEDQAAARTADPVEAYRARLLADGRVDEAWLAALEASVEADLRDAVEAARAAPGPLPEDLFTDVYAAAAGGPGGGHA